MIDLAVALWLMAVALAFVAGFIWGLVFGRRAQWAQMDAWRRNYEAERERNDTTLRLAERKGIKRGGER